VRDRSHWNTTNIRARHPVALGLCSQTDLDRAIERAQRANKTAAAPTPAPAGSEA
jgi:hypothetical protein